MPSFFSKEFQVVYVQLSLVTGDRKYVGFPLGLHRVPIKGFIGFIKLRVVCLGFRVSPCRLVELIEFELDGISKILMVLRKLADSSWLIADSQWLKAESVQYVRGEFVHTATSRDVKLTLSGNIICSPTSKRSSI